MKILRHNSTHSRCVRENVIDKLKRLAEFLNSRNQPGQSIFCKKMYYCTYYCCITNHSQICSLKYTFYYAYRFCGSGIWIRYNSYSLFLLVIWGLGWEDLMARGDSRVGVWNHLEISSLICLVVDVICQLRRQQGYQLEHFREASPYFLGCLKVWRHQGNPLCVAVGGPKASILGNKVGAGYLTSQVF